MRSPRMISATCYGKAVHHGDVDRWLVADQKRGMAERAIERMSMIKSGRAAKALVALVLALGLFAQGARLVFRPDARDDLRRADALFAAGHYHDARAAYAAIVRRAPRSGPALARLGIVYAVRGERPAATETLAAALGAGVSWPEHELVRLYQGWLAAADGRLDAALRFWRTLGEGGPLYGVSRILGAESRLSAGDYTAAERDYQAALLARLAPEWRALALTRLALLRAAGDPAGAGSLLLRAEAAPWLAPTSSLDWTAPLRPAADPSAGQLAVVLRAPADQRAQLLGQIYLGARLYALAQARFAAVDPGGPGAIAAAAYGAYARWSAGQRDEGIRQLQNLVVSHPGAPRPRALLALAYLASGDDASARAQLDGLRALAPRDLATHLAWAEWYAARHDYAATAEEHARALQDAPAEERGPFALALARFHVDTSFQVCEAGGPAAQEAARELPEDQRAWIVLSAIGVSCGDPSGARASAERALQYGRSAEAYYYLGRALARLGDRTGARAALARAADLAPASVWRERAEAQMAALGL